MSKKEDVKPEQVAPPADLNTMLTALAVLLVNNRIEEHRAGLVELSPRYGSINAELAKAMEQKDAKLSAAEQAVKQSRREVQAAISKANEAEVNLRDVKEAKDLSNFQI